MNVCVIVKIVNWVHLTCDYCKVSSCLHWKMRSLIIREQTDQSVNLKAGWAGLLKKFQLKC